MGFTNDEDSDGDGRMPPISATIIDIGVDYREYDDGNDESRLVVFLKPDSDVFGVQTVILSNDHILKVKSNERNVRVGGPERGFDLVIIGNVIESGKLGYKAALWMAKLKALNVKTPEDTGDLTELIGIKAVFKHLTYNEAKGRPKRDAEKAFWVPVELVSTPVKTSIANTVDEPVEKLTEEQSSIIRTLREDILANVDGKTESEIVEWFEKSQHYDGKTVVPLFAELTKMGEEGKLKEKNGVYEVDIEKLGAQAKDDLGVICAENDSPLPPLGVNI